MSYRLDCPLDSCQDVLSVQMYAEVRLFFQSQISDNAPARGPRAEVRVCESLL